MGLTPYYGLNYFGGSTPGNITDDGAKFTGRDRLAIDRMLRALAVGARHLPSTAGSGVPEAPTLTLGIDGGLPGGLTLTYCLTFVDADGLESLPSDEVTITTPDILTAPDDPGVAETTGALPVGLYFYALTAIRGAEESPLGTQTSITLPETAGVTLTLPAVPTGATSFQVWRMNAQDVGWTRVAVVTATEGATYADHGAVPANTNVDDPSQAPPATNLGAAIYSVGIALDSGDATTVTAGGVAAWRIYRTETASAYPEDALVQHVIERDDPGDTGDPDLPLVTTWSDVGGLLTSGVPPLSSTQMQLAPYVLDHVTALPDATAYPEYYPMVCDGVLYLKVGSSWVALGGGGDSGSQLTAQATEDDPAPVLILKDADGTARFVGWALSSSFTQLYLYSSTSAGASDLCVTDTDGYLDIGVGDTEALLRAGSTTTYLRLSASATQTNALLEFSRDGTVVFRVGIDGTLSLPSPDGTLHAVTVSDAGVLGMVGTPPPAVFRGAWDSGTAYPIGHVVQAGTSLYQATAVTTGNDPSTDALAHWTPIYEGA